MKRLLFLSVLLLSGCSLLQKKNMEKVSFDIEIIKIQKGKKGKIHKSNLESRYSVLPGKKVVLGSFPLGLWGKQTYSVRPIRKGSIVEFDIFENRKNFGRISLEAKVNQAASLTVDDIQATIKILQSE